MFYTDIISIFIFIPLCISSTPYLLRSYPTESIVQQSSFTQGPCLDPLKTLSFLQNADEQSLEHNECAHDPGESLLTCKLGVKNASETLDLDSYPLDSIKVLILFVQEFSRKNVTLRVLDLCFLKRFGSALEELAICGYKPPTPASKEYPRLHILDVPALAIFQSNIHTLLISGVNLWQSIEIRQFKSLKHLLIIQGGTIQMQYYHSPHCADCPDVHPPAHFSFHYLIPLKSQLTYFLYNSPYSYDECNYDILKKIQSDPASISTFIVASDKYFNDKDKPICQTCASGLCPLLAACLDEKSEGRRKKDEPFECLCIEDVKAEDDYISCDPMTVHEPMYSTRCNHTPSFWNYITRSMIILSSYTSSSIIVFIASTIFLKVLKK